MTITEPWKNYQSDSLMTYDDIQLFPELYDTTTIIERVTGEADLIERQLRQPGMYPPSKTPLPSTSGFVPRPTPTFQPIAPAASPEPVNTHHTNGQQNTETSPESSLPCGQWTPIGSTSITSTQSQHTPPQSVVSSQPATPQLHNSDNIHSHTQSQKILQSSPTTQSMQQSPNRTNANPATQPFIPAAETHQSMSSSPLQHMDDSAFAVSNQVTSRRTVQSNCTVPSAGQEDTYQQGALLNSRATGQFMKDVNFRRKQKARAMKLAEKNGKEHRINHSSHIKTTDVSTVLVTTKLMIALQDNNNRLPPLATLPVVQVFIKTQVNSQTLHLHIAHTHSHTLNKINLLLM